MSSPIFYNSYLLAPTSSIGDTGLEIAERNYDGDIPLHTVVCDTGHKVHH
jgi:hypothetical protein